jgi:hypothetical protein
VTVFTSLTVPPTKIHTVKANEGSWSMDKLIGMDYSPHMILR